MAKWLTVSDVQQLLHVPEATILRWIRQGDLPCLERRGKFYFNRATLLSWAEAKQIRVEKTGLKKSRRIKPDKKSGSNLIEALRNGGVHHPDCTSTLEIFFRQAATMLPIPEEIKESVASQLLQREELSSTGIGQGIAVPHPRIPMKTGLSGSMVGVFFLDKPLDFKSPDSQMVYTVFVLLSTDTSQHLQLLSQLARILNQPYSESFLRDHPSLEELLEQFQKDLAQASE